ncbi:uncharacterized protein LOC135217981 [Macrobrachium nipponense]|uniref:uncharacterized protein LOC135217981 n=1 Tax=Macrobrachium nipponense TaxID=159736 RepID=UPI0030C7D055
MAVRDTAINSVRLVAREVVCIPHVKMETGPVDTELFIDEVEKRSAIWDTRSADYKDKVVKKRCWEELVGIFCHSEESRDRKIVGLHLQKKWKNLRDSFTKELKKQKSLPSGSGTRNSSYVFFRRLQFLENSVSSKETTSNPENKATEAEVLLDEDVNVAAERGRSETASAKKRVKLNPVDKHFSDVPKKCLLTRQNGEDEREDQDDEKLFCLLVNKELKKVPENIRLMTKIEILNVIQRAQTFGTFPVAQPVQHPHSHNQPFPHFLGTTQTPTPLKTSPSTPSPAAASSVSETQSECCDFSE